MIKNLVFVTLLLVLATLLAACAPGSKVEVNTPNSTLQLASPGPNPEQDKPAEGGRVSGFVQGFWHGLISPVTVVGSFFNPNMQMYEVHNNGKEYNVGFLIGVAIVFLLLGIIGGRWR